VTAVSPFTLPAMLQGFGMGDHEIAGRRVASDRSGPLGIAEPEQHHEAGRQQRTKVNARASGREAYRTERHHSQKQPVKPARWG